MSEDKKEIQKKDETALSGEVQLSKEEMAEMYGGMEQEDVSIPRLVILQGTSPEVTDEKGVSGDFYIKGFEKNLGKSPIEFIVIMRSKSRIRWRDLKDGGGILCSSTDAKKGIGEPGGDCVSCQFSAWQNEEGRPGCDLYQNVIVVLRQDEDWIPIALSGSRTKLKPIKNLNSLLMLEMAKNRPMFSKSYQLEPLKKQNPQGMQYYTYQIVPANGNKPLPPEEQQRALQLFKSLRGKTIKVQEEQTEDQTAPSKDF